MFVVIELQNGVALTASYEDRAEAEAKYHTVLAAAAKSKVAVHSAVMLTGEGYYIKSECYTHGGE